MTCIRSRSTLLVSMFIAVVTAQGCGGAPDRQPQSSAATESDIASGSATERVAPVAADSGQASEPAWRTERSIAGDTTVFRIIGANNPATTLTLVQEQVIGKRNGKPEETFQSIENVVPMPDGGVLFFEYGAYSVRRFDSAGRYVNSLGRSGDGPGEWRSVTRIALTPDRKVLVAGSGRFHLFEPNGELVSSWSMNFPNSSAGRAGSLRAVTSDGYLHVSTWLDDPFYPDSLMSSGRRTNRDAVHRVRIESAASIMRPDGQMPDTAFQPRARVLQPRFEYQNRGVPSRTVIPLTPWYRVTYSTLGYWISGGDDGRYAFVLHMSAGPIRIESDLKPVSAPDAERAAQLYSWTYDLRRFDPGATPSLDLIPRVKAPFKGLVTDSQGRIWVLISQPGTRVAVDTMPDPALQGMRGGAGGGGTARAAGAGAAPTNPAMHRPTEQWIEPSVYDVFSPDGDFLGRVSLPPRSELGNAKGDRIWLVVNDELDVPSVVRYRVNSANASTLTERWKSGG